MLFLSLPMRHCILNPIDLTWANMKKYISDRNTKFNLILTLKLAQEWIHNLDATEAISYVNHVKQCKATFKKADSYVEEIEEELNDDHDEDDYSICGTDTDDDDEWLVC